MSDPAAKDRRRICVVTGSRAEFGLLRSVMEAVRAHGSLELRVLVTGTHLLGPSETWREVAEHFEIAARVEMQRAGEGGRLDDARALGRGVLGMADAFERLNPDCVVVLGDRIEALAGACAASVGGIALAHIHGGDRAEGVADEAMRHAITKLAHLHFPATRQSAERVIRMGEREDRVLVAGSPAVDGLDEVEPMSDSEAVERFGGVPGVMILHHPCGLGEDEERGWARAIVDGVVSCAPEAPVVMLAPNHDPGRAAVMDVLCEATRTQDWEMVDHLPRSRFVALLKLMAHRGGVLVGNSSAGLIECAALGMPAVTIGPRQNGRERGPNVVDVADRDSDAVARGIGLARALDLSGRVHPYGDGDAGRRIAAWLGGSDLGSPGFVRKRNAY